MTNPAKALYSRVYNDQKQITFKELARQTGFDEKALHRMLSRRGNPTARSLAKVIGAIREDTGFIPRVTVAAG